MGQVLHNDGGRVVGHYLTNAEFKQLVLAAAEAEFSRQEATDRANGVGRVWDGSNGKSTAEAIAHLEFQARLARGES